MNNTISILSGIDQPIQRLQTTLYTYLCKKWSLNGDTYQAYGRAYRNRITDGYRPEAFIGADYKALIYDDTLGALSFFAIKDPENGPQGYNIATVSLIFCIDLSKCKPSVTQRLDEQAINDVSNFISTMGNGFTLKTIYRDGDHIFDMYSGQWKRDMLERVTRHPKFCFRLDLTLPYNSLTNSSNC